MRFEDHIINEVKGFLQFLWVNLSKKWRVEKEAAPGMVLYKVKNASKDDVSKYIQGIKKLGAKVIKSKPNLDMLKLFGGHNITLFPSGKDVIIQLVGQSFQMEAFKMSKTMIGFGFDGSKFNPLINHIKKILQEEDIWGFKDLTHQGIHMSIAQITGRYEKDELKREMDKISKNVTFRPKGLELFWGPVVKRQFVVVEYRNHEYFKEVYERLADKFEVRKFKGGVRPHVSILSSKGDEISKDLWEHIRATAPRPPKVKPIAIELFNQHAHIELMT